MKLAPALLLAGLLAAPAAAAEPAVRDLSIALDGVQVLASLRLADAFGPEIRERIDSGLPTGIVYEIELLRDRKRWWDESLDSTRLEVVAMYNAVTHEYLVNTKLKGRLIDSRTVREREALERLMTRFIAVPVFVIRDAAPRERYLIKVRAELGAGDLLGIVPIERATEWTESNKVRPRVP
ncbi:MAG TPA: DUF4390 domain-containing protein [Thermoanaerobaculia bacterium]|nr:DUF4390 domain-containing protein [Thermoanaerobaculia bacterium]